MKRVLQAEDLHKPLWEIGKTIDMMNKLKQVDYVELWFVDIFGGLHSLGIPSYSVTDEHLEKGINKLDSSSIRGFGSVNESDMMLMPDTGTFAILPPDYDKDGRKNARMFVDLYVNEMSDGEDAVSNLIGYDRDSRKICQLAEKHIEKFGLSKAMWGPEIEFFVFDRIVFSPYNSGAVGQYGKFDYRIESEGSSNEKRHYESNHLPKSGYYKAQPKDTLGEFRKDVCDDMHMYFGTKIEAQHHEVATMGQCEINIAPGNTLSIADTIVTMKNMIMVKAKKRSKIATFMPKPVYGDNASAMHLHHSLWFSDDQNAMYDENDSDTGLSQLARYCIGGILEHAPALCALSNPTTNSYKRLVSGFEAPVNQCWGVGNRSVAIRIPSCKSDNNCKRIEYRVSDGTSNIYLLEASLLMAELDGIAKKLDPGDPIKENAYKMSEKQKRKYNIRPLPHTLRDALDALDNDRKFLAAVFSNDFLDAYLSLKYSEYDEFAQTPTTWEFARYANG